MDLKRIFASLHCLKHKMKSGVVLLFLGLASSASAAGKKAFGQLKTLKNGKCQALLTKSNTSEKNEALEERQQL